MSDDLVVPQVPRARKDDAEDVSWALSTADAMWTRGDHAEALRWIRRAAEAASEVNDDARALELAKAAADLSTAIVAPSAPSFVEPTEVAEATEVASIDFESFQVPPAPPLPSRMPPGGRLPTAAPTPIPTPVPTPSPSSSPRHEAPEPTPVPAATGARRWSTLPPPTVRAEIPSRRPGPRAPLGPQVPAAGSPATAAAPAPDPAAAAPVAAAPSTSPSPPRVPSHGLEPTPLAPRVLARPGGYAGGDGSTRQLPALADSDADGVERALGLGRRERRQPPLETDPEIDLSRTQSGPTSAALLGGLHRPLATSQAVRVVLWHDAQGVHVAPAGTVVSAITVDAMLVALDPEADLASWLSPHRTPKK